MATKQTFNPLSGTFDSVSEITIGTANGLSVTATQALSLALATSSTPGAVANIGAANGVATLDASGLVPITQIPPAALERLVIVADQAARFALTTATVQNGDTVKQVDTDVMYFVSDDTNLNNASGYTIYTAGTASSVPWSGITGIPAPVSALLGTNTGDVTVAVVGSVPNANGASISGQVLTLQPANATNPGVLTIGTQTIAGAKTFTSPITGTTTGNANVNLSNITATAIPDNLMPDTTLAYDLGDASLRWATLYADGVNLNQGAIVGPLDFQSTGTIINLVNPTTAQGAATKNYVDTADANKVTGPASATDNAVARFDLATGKLIQNSGVTIGDTDGIVVGNGGGTSAFQAHLNINAGLSLNKAQSAISGSNATLATPTTAVVELTNAALVSVSLITNSLSNQFFILKNLTGNPITLINQATASGANRPINTGTGGNITVANGGSVSFQLQSTVSQWDVVAVSQSPDVNNYVYNATLSPNYIGNGTFEFTATGYAAYSNTAQATPVTGSGGSPTVTIARSTSSPLFDTASGLFTHGASNQQWQGFSYDFTIDSAVSTSATPCTISGFYNVASGTYASGDLTIWIYDITNAQVIQPTGSSILNVIGAFPFTASFPA